MFFKAGFIGALVAVALSAPALAEVKNPLLGGDKGETWSDLKFDVFGDKEIKNADGLFTMDAPYRAHDAAIVPVTLVQSEGSDKTIKKITLIVDENPAPVVAQFEFGPSVGSLDFQTRVRIDLYSNVRAIAETEDGELYMTGRFVKASGGCSAPALKDMEAAVASAGKMKMRFFSPETEASDLPKSGERREAQVMVRHPNYSGMQMNQVTQLFIPAHFMDNLEVTQGDDLVFRMTAGISISQDPVFRFKYVSNGADAFAVKATDTEGAEFKNSFPIDDGSS